jgi:diacylglycerol kinase family enzyme
MKHLFVINPKSFPDKREMSDFITSVEELIGESATIRISRYPRDAVAKVNNFLETATENNEKVRVYAVGGDGILFDCLNGMQKYRDHELASVPYGNSNDFLRAFGDENVPLFKDIKKLSESPSIWTDVFLCSSNVAIANAAIGLESSTILVTEQMAKKLATIPFLRFFIPTLYKIGAIVVLLNKKLRSQYYNISLDGEDYSGEYIDINIGNTFANGGRNIPSPYALPNDGKLNAIFIKKMSVIKSLLRIGAFVSGNFDKYPDSFFQVTFEFLHATSDEPIKIATDGEAFYTSDLYIETFHDALRIIAPEGLTYKTYKETSNVK